MTGQASMQGKTVLVTGATAGIGLASAAALVQAGARVIGVGRDAARCQAAEATLRTANPQAQISFLLADLSLQSQVRQLAQAVQAELAQRQTPALDGLVNNAGVFCARLERTADGIERTLAVNHLAPFLLTHLLLPQLVAAPFSRVVTISSASHYGTLLDLKRLTAPFIYQGLWAYKVSKLLNVLFTAEFNRRMAATRVRAFAVDPGLVNTEIGLKNSKGLSYWVWQLRMRKGAPPEKPAQTVLYLCSQPDLQTSHEIYWRDCHPKAPSRLSLNPKAGRGLWLRSAQLCGL